MRYLKAICREWGLESNLQSCPLLLTLLSSRRLTLESDKIVIGSWPCGEYQYDEFVLFVDFMLDKDLNLMNISINP